MLLTAHVSAASGGAPELMLLTRVLTALVLAPLALVAVLWLPTALFGLLVLALALLAGAEWLLLSGVSRRVLVLPLLVLFGVGLAVIQWTEARTLMLWAALVLWPVLIGLVFAYPRSQALVQRRIWTLLSGGIVLLGALAAFLWLHAVPKAGPWLLIWLLFIVWCADVGGYFAGRALGRHKLALRVSPGKTWEGAIGGMLLGLLAAGLLAMFVPALAVLALPLWLWLGLAAVLVVMSVFGDLYESVLKRSHGAKDSGQLLPGHGGILDRVDALLAAAPLAALLLTRLPF